MGVTGGLYGRGMFDAIDAAIGPPGLTEQVKAIALTLVLSVVAGLAVADASTTGEIGPATGITPNGRDRKSVV